MLKKFTRLSFSEKILFAEALFLIYTAKCLTVILPFKLCLKLTRNKDFSPEKPTKQQLESLRRSLKQAQRLVFWENVCLVQSMAAKWMLRRRKIRADMIFGFSFDEQKKMIAHAWVTVNDFEIVPKSGDYRELHSV